MRNSIHEPIIEHSFNHVNIYFCNNKQLYEPQSYSFLVGRTLSKHCDMLVIWNNGITKIMEVTSSNLTNIIRKIGENKKTTLLKHVSATRHIYLTS